MKFLSGHSATHHHVQAAAVLRCYTNVQHSNTRSRHGLVNKMNTSSWQAQAQDGKLKLQAQAQAPNEELASSSSSSRQQDHPVIDGAWVSQRDASTQGCMSYSPSSSSNSPSSSAVASWYC